MGQSPGSAAVSHQLAGGHHPVEGQGEKKIRGERTGC